MDLKVGVWCLLFVCASIHQITCTSYITMYDNRSSYKRPMKYKIMDGQAATDAHSDATYTSPYDGRVYFKAEPAGVDTAYGSYETIGTTHDNSQEVTKTIVRQKPYLSDHLLKEMGEDFSEYYRGQAGHYNVPSHSPVSTGSTKGVIMTHSEEQGLAYPSVISTDPYQKKLLIKSVPSTLLLHSDASGHSGYPEMTKSIDIDPAMTSYYNTKAPDPLNGGHLNPPPGHYPPSPVVSSSGENIHGGSSELYSDKPIKGYFDHRTGRYRYPIGGYGYPQSGRHLGYYQRRR